MMASVGESRARQRDLVHRAPARHSFGPRTSAGESSRPRRGAAVAVVLAVVRAACQSPPLANPTGTKAGIAATASADHGDGRVTISKVRVTTMSTRTDYERKKFGSGWMDGVSPSIPFARNGCDTRNDMLRRDLTALVVRAGTNDCVIVGGKLVDPYSAKTIDFVKADANKVQIDHVVPLSYAWKMGAANWTDAKRKDFANDPINLLATDGPTNGSKGDKGPGKWLPPNVKIRCSYSIRFAQVAKKYDVPVTSADKNKMNAQCS